MKSKIPASVGIITFNEEKVLRKALESVRFFDDIIVCDGGSTDRTIKIAKEFGARIIQQDTAHKNPDNTIANFSGVRNQTLAIAKYDWFLFIDSDEYLSVEILPEIKQICSTDPTENDALAYWMPRKRVYKGKIVECTTTYPSYQMRLFHKKGVTEFIKAVHERIKVRPDTKIGYLKNCEYVPFDFTYQEWRNKLNYYLIIEQGLNANKTVNEWLRYNVWQAMKLTLLYGFRHLRLLIFCRGVKMPIWYELMQHWYNWKIVFLTGKKFIYPNKKI